MRIKTDILNSSEYLSFFFSGYRFRVCLDRVILEILSVV